MCVLLALVNPYWVKIWINEVRVAFQRLNQFTIFIKAIFFDCNLLVIELTESMTDKKDIRCFLV